MNLPGRIFARAALCLFLLCLAASLARATTVVMLSDDELIIHSRYILTGDVLAVSSAWDEGRQTVWTYVEVEPRAVLKGAPPAGRLVLRQLGGATAQAIVNVHGQPQFAPGQEVLLYLNSSPDGSLHVAHAFMGLYHVKRGGDGRKYVERSFDARQVDILARADAVAVAVTDQAPYGEFVRRIEATVRREQAAILKADAELWNYPAVAAPAEYAGRQEGGVTPNYELIGGGVRWPQADRDQPVLYYVNPANAPVAGGGLAEVERAMLAWSQQSGARLRLQVGGPTSNCGLVSDGTNTISFGDCLGQLDPPVGCAGVFTVARAQIYTGFETSTVNGRTFYNLHDTDIVFNKNLGCFLGVSANLAEVACHELGHTIGLGHSADPSAIMYAMASGGRDARLGADDIAGVLAIYPAAPGGGGGGGGGGSGGGGGTGGAVNIATTSLPNGFVGVAYNAQLVATGGSQSYTWTITSGGLPPGLSLELNGRIYGTPSRSGDYTVGFHVADTTGNAANTASIRLTLRVLGNNDPTRDLPRVLRVTVKKGKKLSVYGMNFSATSTIRLNNLLLTPRSFAQEDGFGRLYYKGRLDLRADAPNVVVVFTNGVASAPYIF